ncbi:MAG: sulfurtransferase TusA [Pseudomonadales bacterium]|nr:sulfurtransferase TusA [Pseudomonadales bacterium]|tara:strand:+ start:448 stop:684 length:237 start_codon:yes stop_codon:yes gene_type:complete
MSDSAATTLDTRGLTCPEPVMMLHNAVRDVAAGELVQVLASDPSTQRDIPRFCSFLGHELLEQHESDGIFHYLIRKAG